MTIALDHVQEGDWDALNRVVDTLRVLVPDAGTRSVGIRFGTNTVTFTASASSAGTVVSHGLGVAPVFIATQQLSTTTLLYGPGTVGATTFTAAAFSAGGAITGTFSFYWIALG